MNDALFSLFFREYFTFCRVLGGGAQSPDLPLPHELTVKPSLVSDSASLHFIDELRDAAALRLVCLLVFCVISGDGTPLDLVRDIF